MRKKTVPFWPFGLLIFAILLFIDQYTKYVVKTLYLPNESHSIFTWLWFTYVPNTGATWGFFQGSNTALIWLSLIALGVLIYFYTEFKTTIEKTCFVIIIAGLMGNFIDRAMLGFVVDFLDFGWWPVFNIADSSISVGVAVFLLHQLLQNSSISLKLSK